MPSPSLRHLFKQTLLLLESIVIRTKYGVLNVGESMVFGPISGSDCCGMVWCGMVSLPAIPSINGHQLISHPPMPMRLTLKSLTMTFRV